MLIVLASLSVAIWLALLLVRGAFWCADQRLGATIAPAEWPAVVAVIPARDEAASIGPVLEAHAASNYPGPLAITMVDDGSRDATREIALGVASASRRPIHVIDGQVLPDGWSGKLWALHQGIAEALRRTPEARYILLTDADILHRRDTLARLVAKAEGEGLHLVSLMARLDARGLWGGLLIPAFVFFFQKLYPFPLVNDPRASTAGAAGGCILVRREALDGTGGIERMGGALIDDCTLAARVKLGPPRRRIWLGLARGEVTSLRDNRHIRSIWKMVRRTAFVQLRQSWVLLAGATLGMALTYLVGPFLLLTSPFHGDWFAGFLGAVAWGLCTVAYMPTMRLYDRGTHWALTLPAAAALYMAMTIDSARAHALGRGGAWKGRTYSDG